MRFSDFVTIAIAPCEHLNAIQPICCDKKSQSQWHRVNSPSEKKKTCCFLVFTIWIGPTNGISRYRN